MKLSPWFDKDTPPVRVGVYQVRESDEDESRIWYAYWDGKKFGYRSFPPDDAYLDRGRYTSLSGRAIWRGILK